MISWPNDGPGACECSRAALSGVSRRSRRAGRAGRSSSRRAASRGRIRPRSSPGRNPRWVCLGHDLPLGTGGVEQRRVMRGRAERGAPVQAQPPEGLELGDLGGHRGPEGDPGEAAAGPELRPQARAVAGCAGRRRRTGSIARAGSARPQPAPGRRWSACGWRRRSSALGAVAGGQRTLPQWCRCSSEVLPRCWDHDRKAGISGKKALSCGIGT